MAQPKRRDAHEHLRRRDTADLLDTMQHPVDIQRQRVAALDTWQQWAHGHGVGNNELVAAVDTLTTVRGSDRPFAEALADTLQQWANRNRVDLSAHPTPAAAVRLAGLELEL